MNNQSEVIRRIREIMNYFSLNQSAMAKTIGVKQPNLSAILSGKRACEEAIINKIVLSLDINKSWLLTGEGEMLAEDENLPLPPTPTPAAGADTSQQLIDKLLAIIAEKDSLIRRQAAEIGALRAHLPDLPTA